MKNEKAGIEAAKVDFVTGSVANMGVVKKAIKHFFPKVDVSKLDEGTIYDLLKNIIDNI